MIPLFETVRYYPYEPLFVWNEVIYLWNESLWQGHPEDYRPIVGNCFRISYPELSNECFTGVFESEIIRLLLAEKFCMRWIPQMKSDASPQYELSFTFHPHLGRTRLAFVLAGLDLSDCAERAVSRMFGPRTERALNALGIHLDHLAAAQMGHVS